MTETYINGVLDPTWEAREQSYEQAMDSGVPRQLARLKYNLTPDAYDQLTDHTFIFHYKQAWDAFLGSVRTVLTGRCYQCGARHWGKTLRYTVNGENRGGCFGWGWLRSWRAIPRTWWFHGRHGED
jgi:hypothetical protein